MQDVESLAAVQEVGFGNDLGMVDVETTEGVLR
jgi:hypothetical protein